MTTITAPASVTFRPVPLRIGLVLGTLLALASVPSATFDIGFDGTAWDALVLFLAIFTPAVALVSLVLVPFAWNGARRPCRWFILVQLVSIIASLPAFVLFFVDDLPPIAPISAAIGIVLTLLVVLLVVKGRRRDE